MYYALLAGIFAALGSFLGKLSGMSPFDDYLMLKVLCVAAMIFINTCSLRNYVKALHQCNSTIIATIISTAVNYVLSALLGTFIFGETLSLIWWTGFSFIIMGLTLVIQDDTQTKTHKLE